jgi:hypothetical protein
MSGSIALEKVIHMGAIPENLQSYKRWLDETRSTHGHYDPLLQNGLPSHIRTKKQARNYCNERREHIIERMREKKKGEDPMNRHMCLQLLNEAGATILYDVANMRIYSLVSRDPTTGSLFLYGPERILTMLGGRNELGGIAADMRDNVFDGGFYQKDGKPVR